MPSPFRSCGTIVSSRWFCAGEMQRDLEKRNPRRVDRNRLRLSRKCLVDCPLRAYGWSILHGDTHDTGRLRLVCSGVSGFAVAAPSKATDGGQCHAHSELNWIMAAAEKQPRHDPYTLRVVPPSPSRLGTRTETVHMLAARISRLLTG